MKPSPAARDRRTLRCSEDTPENFNMSGVEALPFLRAAFYDMDGDGLADMVAGSRDGFLALYKNMNHHGGFRWKREEGYFDGIRAGAFSNPAIGDLDGDGKAEVAVGTGGFSSASGRILFFRNEGTERRPMWREVAGVQIKVGDDASVAIVDYDFDGKPDLIAGNSQGRIFFFRNITAGGKIGFRKEASIFGKRSFGMYAVPAAVRVKDRVFLAVGNSMGKLRLFELKRNRGSVSARELNVKPAVKSFASPAFADLVEKGRYDLVLADGDGVLTYYENQGNGFVSWKDNRAIFDERISGGPACAPTLCDLGERTVLVLGNIDGTLRAFELGKRGEGLPWVEKRGFLKGIKVSGFARGSITEWEGKAVVIVGQSNGNLRAFMNQGTEDQPVWIEENGFFGDTGIKEHSTPTVFDLDGDGRWELISGASDGRIYSFRVKGKRNGLPEWERTGVFNAVKVDGFSVPSLVRAGGLLHLFVGQQDGRIRTYVSEERGGGEGPGGNALTFTDTGYLKDIRMSGHSSPFVRLKGEMFEIVSGDYDGNVRHFLCGRTDLFTRVDN